MAATSQSYKWDIFLAHAGADTGTAEALYELLSGKLGVFLDSRCLLLGDDWDKELAEAQHCSFITAVLISTRTEQAYYQREEIAAAIAMARNGEHRVVPIYIGAISPDDAKIPYGLRLKHGITVPTIEDLQEVADKLVDLCRKLPSTSTSSKLQQSVAPQTAIVEDSIRSALLLSRQWGDDFVGVPHLVAALGIVRDSVLNNFLTSQGIQKQVWIATAKASLQHPAECGVECPQPTDAYSKVLSNADNETKQEGIAAALDDRTLLLNIINTRGDFVTKLLGLLGLSLGQLETHLKHRLTPYADDDLRQKLM